VTALAWFLALPGSTFVSKNCYSLIWPEEPGKRFWIIDSMTLKNAMFYRQGL
jgi:hypothetical protein